MLRKKQKRILSWILSLALILFNFNGVIGTKIVDAAGIDTSTNVTVARKSLEPNAFTLGIGQVTSPSVAPVNATNKTFDIVEITDFHGQLLDSTNTKPVGAALAKVVKDVKTANPGRTLIIGGGDLYQGTPTSNVLRGVPVQKVLSNMGMEVTALGNHEFDWGLDIINTETMIGANYNIVCANMYKKGTSNRPYQPYKIITKDGVKIAVIGAILKEAPGIIMPALVDPFDFRDPATEINIVAKEIRDGNLADIVLADVHDGGSSLNTMVNKLHGVDAVFGGHTHSIGDVVNKDADGLDVPTLIAAATGKGFINLKITVDSTNKIVGFSPKGSNWKGLTVTTTSATDPDCKKIVDDASTSLLPIFNEVIGTNDNALTKSQVDSPYGESQLGNWMADVVKNYSKSPAEVGMVNNGGIRLSPIPSGDITVGTIFNIMPFDNTICTTIMTGAQLKFIFEQAVQNDGNGIQISGVKFVYDSSKPSYKPAVVDANGTVTTPEIPGQRVLSMIRESNGTVVKDTDTLKVNAPDFVATGGDTFTGFLAPEIVASLVDSHENVRDALNADVRDKGKMTVVMENRIDNQMKDVDPGATISVVATSDVHGNVLNFDYGTNAATSKGQGLAKVSTYVKGLRATNPNVMLIDNGDTIQGTPLAYYYNMIDKTTTYPMSAVMGAMGYDSWTLGNHEFNYGLEVLNRIKDDAKDQGIDVLSANTYKADNKNFVKPYTMKSFVVNGKTISVAVLGLTTKTISSWEDPAHYDGLHFNDLVDEAKKWVPVVKADGADVIIVAAHTGEEGVADIIPENQAKALATQVSGIDAIVAGHAHSILNDINLKNPEGKVVPILEPGKWAQNVSQIDIAVNAAGIVTGLTTKNVAMDTIAEDHDITALIAPYQAKTLEYTSTILGQSKGEYKGNKQITEPTEIMELINKVQAGAAGTQLSIAAPLSLSSYIPKGDITIKDIMGVYVYENFLYGVKMNGKQIKDWMEYTVRYYKRTSGSTDPIVKDADLNIADYNLDQLYGASYDIDLTEPAGAIDSVTKKMISGNRIKNLKFNGRVIKDSDVFTVAINNYRYNGGGGFMAAAGISSVDTSLVTYNSAKALGDDGQVRSLMMKYVKDNKTITPSSARNWKILSSSIKQEVPVTGISLEKAYFSIGPKMSETLEATLLPGNATNKKVSWKSSDTLVASVDDNGKVTGHKIGLAKISATTDDGNYKDECTVAVVSKPVNKVRINKKDIIIKVGKNEKLTALVGPGNSDIKDVIWKCDSSIIKIIEKNGKSISVIGISTGKAKVTVTSLDGGYKATCDVTVIDKKK
ncbi:5'-nucleotidase C-terminal domain-containing protein [Clostridium sp. CM028]|uniref:5'-nucleotidase C-terminal domain-containing protein n=1 Tax=Clostridium sp. CM028 TaxID=2851575 RepID=UPI001C6EA508|nr:5'-nucleotidase C-terminal domain-containing protein [Clostridium sp. CM028]MBW9149412.1 5'-nucleotidase C-terminal domain-containing protein [Clostridium sp. CM028]WLC61685.1 5'-nucleotidase C-terminal domain-containing protein [Clostridium sp. CM028]